MSARIIFCLIAVVISLSPPKFCDAAVLPAKAKSNVQPNADIILRCRKKCFSKILSEYNFRGNLVQYLRCKNTPNCYMCWDYCRAVNVAQVDLARSMCGDKKFCTGGCKVACNFHRIKTINDIIDEMSNNV